MPTLQAAIVAAITQVVSLLVSFAVINNTIAGVVISTATALVATGFVVAQAIENHGKSVTPPVAK